MVKWKRDLYCSIILMIVSAVLFIYAGTFRTTNVDIWLAQPDVYIRFWLGAMFILSLLMLIRTLRNKPQDMTAKIFGKMQIFTVVTMTLYIFLLEHLGFALDTFLGILVTTAVFCIDGMNPKPKGKKLAKLLAKYSVFSAVSTALIWALFTQLLDALLPRCELLDYFIH